MDGSLTTSEKSAIPSISNNELAMEFSIPTEVTSGVSLCVETNNDLREGNWEEVARRLPDGSWEGDVTVMEGVPEEGRIPVSLQLRTEGDGAGILFSRLRAE